MNKLSLRVRIFVTMLFLVAIASVLIAWVTVNQYKKQTENYYTSRFERKETAARKNIDYELERTIYPVAQQFLGFIFKERIYEIAKVHNMKMSVYNMNGESQVNSFQPWFMTHKEFMQREVLKSLKENGKFTISNTLENGNIDQTSYGYIRDQKRNKIGVLKVEYLQDNTHQVEELQSFLNRLYLVYVVMFVIAIIIAYFLSSYITRSLKTIADKIQEINFVKENKKLPITDLPSELKLLVSTYNDVIDKLNESAEKLAKSEREQAWREMAKQVAHEIKNPLTPMRLTVQSFERNFDPNDEEIKEKVKDYSEILVDQIDVMTSIASAFSDFAQMPKKNVQELNLVSVVKSTIDVFADRNIGFETSHEEILLDLDKNQLIRVVTNLVKNAVQASEEKSNPEIKVKIEKRTNKVEVLVIDNGKGIAEDQKNLIFEPKFTTKTSGMGLGLAMVKSITESYKGEVSFSSVEGVGTQFKISFPI